MRSTKRRSLKGSASILRKMQHIEFSKSGLSNHCWSRGMRRLRRSSATNRRRMMKIVRKRHKQIRESWLALLIKSGKRRSKRRKNSRERQIDTCKENRSWKTVHSMAMVTEFSSWDVKMLFLTRAHTIQRTEWCWLMAWTRTWKNLETVPDQQSPSELRRWAVAVPPRIITTSIISSKLTSSNMRRKRAKMTRVKCSIRWVAEKKKMNTRTRCDDL